MIPLARPHPHARYLAPEVVQTSMMDCGPAALESLVEGFGLSVNYGRLREACQTGVDGTSISTMDDIGRFLGLDTEEMMLPADHLLVPEAHALPALVVVRNPSGANHFIVVWSISGPWIQVMDPAEGRQWISRGALIDRLYRHYATVPASAWREWIEGKEFLATLDVRLAALDIARADRDELCAAALASPGWQAMAALDAATRMTTAIAHSGAVARGAPCLALIRRQVESDANDAYPLILSEYWSAWPVRKRPAPSADDAAAEEDDEEEMLNVVGVVLVRARGRRDPERASVDAGSDDDGAATPGGTLPPELATALTDKSVGPGRTLLGMLVADGIATPIVLAMVLVASAALVMVEAILLRGFLEVGHQLALASQRVAAVAALAGFLVLGLLVELPLVAGALRLGRALDLRLRMAFLAKIPRLDDRYFRSRLVSDMVERGHSLHLIRSVPQLGVLLLQVSAQLVLTVAGIAWLQPASAPLALVAAVVCIALPLVCQPLMAERDLRVRSHAGALGRFYLDALVGLLPIRVHGARRAMQRKQEALLVQWVRAGLRYYAASTIVEGVLALCGIGMAVLVVNGVASQTTSGLLLLVYWALSLPALGQRISVLARIYPIQRNVVVRLLEPLGTPEPLEPQPREPLEPRDDAPAAPAAGVAIRMSGVSVEAAGNSVLADIELAIAPGEHVAIVGASGAGKSSLVGLLLGWYRPARGTVAVDGRPRAGAPPRAPRPPPPPPAARRRLAARAAPRHRVGRSRGHAVEPLVPRQPALRVIRGRHRRVHARRDPGEGAAPRGARASAGRPRQRARRGGRAAVGRRGPAHAGRSRAGAHARSAGHPRRAVSRPRSPDAARAAGDGPRVVARRHAAVGDPRHRRDRALQPRARDRRRADRRGRRAGRARAPPQLAVRRAGARRSRPARHGVVVGGVAPHLARGRQDPRGGPRVVTARLVEPTALVWPIARIGEALVALARRTGLGGSAAPAPRDPPGDPAKLDRWLAAAADQLGVTLDPVTATHRDADAVLASLHPAIVQLPDGVLVVVEQRGATLACLAPDGVIRRTARSSVGRALQASHELPHRARISALLAGTELSKQARERAEAGMLTEFLASADVLHAWLLRLPPSARFGRQLRDAGLVRLGAVLVAVHAAHYLLFLLSWWAIGKAVLQGDLAPGWLWGWALLLLCSIPMLMLSTWCQGKLAVGFGMLLRRRLLAGALALPPAVVNRDGVGGLIGRTLEADTMERLALGGGLASALSLIELALAVAVLAAGAGGWPHAGLLVAWVMVCCAVLGVRVLRTKQRWTDQRLALTGLTVERIVGHRTRLAQDVPERWHDGEDEALASYLDGSTELDRRILALHVIVPRGWLIAGLCVLAPAFVDGADPAALATGVGGVVLAWLSLNRLGAGIDQLATAFVAWQRVAPLFHAAAGVPPATDQAAAPRPAPAPGRVTPPEYAIAPPPVETEPVLEMVDVAFRHPRRATDVLAGCDLVIRAGDRVLVRGPSGSGKSTLVSLLAGMHQPKRGLLLARGLDLSCLGDAGWRARVAVAPQFHDNHVLTESFAFNLLMSRGWPPRPEDLLEARVVCRELGLDSLLERMPGGIYETVGETGWQLSHGEKSRLFIARALLQRTDVVILDESLAALDPENMARALRCLRARVRSLVVIAHP